MSQYLGKMEGYAKENMLKKCTQIVETLPPPPEEGEPEVLLDGEPSPTVIRRTRAQALLDGFTTAK